MSEAARNERAFLRYLHQDDPEKLKRELEAFEGQYAGDPYADWWSTSIAAKVSRLLDLESRRLARAHQGNLDLHKAGLTSVVFAIERSVDEEECQELLAKIPRIKEFGDVWIETARRLKAAFPTLDFAHGQADAIQAFLSPNDPNVQRDPFGAPAKHASVLSAWEAWKNTVAQEPRRAPAGTRGANEDLREANNLWRSWLAYTEVLEKKYPAVLEAALLDLGVVRRRSKSEGDPFHLVRERRRRRPPLNGKLFLNLAFGDDWLSCVNIDEALYQVVHWYDHLVENGRLPALPPLPRIPTVEEAALDPVRTVNGLAAKIEKRVYHALGLHRDRHYHPELRVNSYPSEIPRIRTPGLNVPDYVRDRAVYDAWRRCGLLAPIQYLVTLTGLPQLKTLGKTLIDDLHRALRMAMTRATYSMSWEVSPFVFAGQAHDEAELREDLTYLDAFLAQHVYHYLPPQPANANQEFLSLQKLRIGFQVFRGASLVECEAQLAKLSPYPEFGWDRLKPGDVIKREEGSPIKLG